MAGLGTLDPRADHKYYDKAYLFADVVVIGGGPAGLEAAIAAAEGGADTLLIEEMSELGGSLLYGRIGDSRDAADTLRRDLVAKARSLKNLTILTETVVSGLFTDDWVAAIGGNRLLQDPHARNDRCSRQLRSADRLPQQRPPRHPVRHRRSASDALVWRAPG